MTPNAQSTSPQANLEALQKVANRLRILSIRATTRAASGHPTSCCSAADLVSALFFHQMKFDPTHPRAVGNDRFVLSKGHAAPLLYAAWSETGHFADKELDTLREISSPFEGHPTPRLDFVDLATGSLGQGLTAGLGMALNAKLDLTTDYKTYVLMGDGELAEGSVWEAASLAGLRSTNNLIAIVDVNRLGQSQPTAFGHQVEVYRARFESFGWDTQVIDGHNMSQIVEALSHAGRGSKPLAPRSTTPAPAAKYPADKAVATRKAFGNALTRLGEVMPEIVVIDGDVENSTYTNEFAKAYPERFIECFISEQNMVGISTGFASVGKVPFTSTFAAFFARAADQIRMAAVSGCNIKLVGTHSGISIGEDGPSQMGLEDFSIMRAMQGSIVLSPCDAYSTEKLVEKMARHPGLAYLRTARPETDIIYTAQDDFEIGGARILKQSPQDKVTVVATGITVFEALKAHELLAAQGIAITVIDAYSIKPLAKDLIAGAMAKTGNLIISVEDHYPEGGLGDALAGELSSLGARVHKLAVYELPHSGKKDELMAKFKINAKAIVELTVKIKA
jgi:transketolase